MKFYSKNKVIIWLWSKVWSKWLGEGDTVVAVKGWRTALINSRRFGANTTLTPCFWWFD